MKNDFAKHVEGKEDAFALMLKIQLADLFSTKVYNIKEMKLSPGSIKSNFKIVAFEEDEATTMEANFKTVKSKFLLGQAPLVMR